MGTDEERKEGIGEVHSEDTDKNQDAAAVKKKNRAVDKTGTNTEKARRKKSRSVQDPSTGIKKKKRPAENSGTGQPVRRKKRPAENSDAEEPVRRKKRPAESSDSEQPVRRKKRPVTKSDETAPTRRKKRRPSGEAVTASDAGSRRRAAEGPEMAGRRKAAEDSVSEQQMRKKKAGTDAAAFDGQDFEESQENRPKYAWTVNADGVRERRTSSYTFLPDEPPEPDQETLRRQREEEEQKELESGLLAEEELREGEISEEMHRARRRAAKQRAARKRAEDQRKMQRIAIGAGVLVIILFIGIFIVHRLSGGKNADNGSARSETALATGESAGQDGTAVPADESVAQTTAAEPAPVSASITLTFTGDCTFGRDQSFDYDTSFDAFYEEFGYEYFFDNVRSIFEQDDLTVVNFEGTLTTADDSERLDKQYAFKADPEYVKILSSSSVEAANIANNHSSDYGEQSYTDTLKYLAEAGITSFGYSDSKVVDVKGVKVGLVGILELFEEKDCQYKMIEQIDAVKAQGAQVVVVTMHWGEEAQYYYDEDQYDLGRIAIDHGADLVIGHHPHRVQAIETYKGKNIVYSVGNFCFGGNYEPSDMDSFIYQQTFTVRDGQLVSDNVTKIIPISISSASSYNNYQPTPYDDPDEIERIIAKIKDLTIEPGVPLTGDTGSTGTTASDAASSLDNASLESGVSDTDSSAEETYSETQEENYDEEYDTE